MHMPDEEHHLSEPVDERDSLLEHADEIAAHIIAGRFTKARLLAQVFRKNRKLFKRATEIGAI